MEKTVGIYEETTKEPATTLANIWWASSNAAKSAE